MDDFTPGETTDGQKKLAFWRYKAAAYDPNNGGPNPYLDSNSANFSIKSDLWLLRLIAKEFYANHVVAAGLINNLASAIVGTGFGVSVDGPNQKMNDALEKHIKRYFNSTECDASDRRTMSELMEVCVREWLLSGECFGMIVNPTKFQRYQTKLRILDTDTVCNPESGGNDLISYGLEVDKYGTPVCIYVKQPNGSKSFNFRDKDGKRRVFQLANDQYAVQDHGVPILTTAYRTLCDLSVYQSSEVRAAANASQINVIVKSNALPEFNQALSSTWSAKQKELGGNSNTPALGPNVPSKKKIIGISPSNMIEMMPGDTIEQFKNERPTTVFGDFCDYNIGLVCAACGFSSEFVYKKFKDMNYSSSKMSIKQSYVEAEKYQNKLINLVIKPLLVKFIEELQETGAQDIDPEVEAMDFVEDFIRISPPAPDIVDSNKEAQTQINLVNAKMISREQGCANLGELAYDKALQQIARERQEMEALGIPLDDAEPEAPTQDVGKPASDNSTRG